MNFLRELFYRLFGFKVTYNPSVPPLEERAYLWAYEMKKTNGLDTLKKIRQYYGDGTRLLSAQKLSTGDIEGARLTLAKAEGVDEFFYMLENRLAKKGESAMVEPKQKK